MNAQLAAYVVKWQGLDGTRDRRIDPAAVAGLRGSGALPVLGAMLAIGVIAAAAGQFVG